MGLIESFESMDSFIDSNLQYEKLDIDSKYQLL